MNPKLLPIRSGFLIMISLALIVFSFWQWGSVHPDTSQLIFGVGFGFAGLYVAYDQWYKSNEDKKYSELVQMCDSFLNWKIKHESGVHKLK